MDEILTDLMQRRDQAAEQLAYHQLRVEQVQAQFDTLQATVDDYKDALATIGLTKLALGVKP